MVKYQLHEICVWVLGGGGRCEFVCVGGVCRGVGLSGVGLSVYQNFGQREIEAT